MEYNQKNSLTKIYSASGYGKRGKMNLYLGCKQAAENKKLLKQLGIKVRVPCLHATKYKLRPDHSFVDAKNTCANELVEGWPGSWEDIIAAAEMVVNLLETVGDVLLFCIQGANRSPFIAAIALLLLTKNSASDVVVFLGQVRRIVDLSSRRWEAKPGPTPVEVLGLVEEFIKQQAVDARWWSHAELRSLNLVSSIIDQRAEARSSRARVFFRGEGGGEGGGGGGGGGKGGGGGGGGGGGDPYSVGLCMVPHILSVGFLFS